MFEENGTLKTAAILIQISHNTNQNFIFTFTLRYVCLNLFFLIAVQLYHSFETLLLL